MKRPSVVTIVGLVLLPFLSSCASTPDPSATKTVVVTVTPTQTQTPETTAAQLTPPPGEKTILIEGKYYTCQATLDMACGTALKAAFVKWGDKIDSFVRSGRLGPLGDGADAPLTYEHISRLGLHACMISETNHFAKDFVADGKILEPSATGTELLPFWFEAQKTICPEIPFTG